MTDLACARNCWWSWLGRGLALLGMMAAFGCGGDSDESSGTDGSVTTTSRPSPSVGESGIVLPSLPVPATTSPMTTAPSTTAAAETPAPAVTTVAPMVAPPTTVQLGFASADQLPPIPAGIEGYVPYLGVQSETFRVFEGNGLQTPSEFSGQMNHCSEAFWVARWRSLNPDVLLQGGRAPYDADVVEYEPEPWLMPPDSQAGYISGHICERPVLLFGSTLNGNESNLVDVAIEWQYYDVAVQGGTTATAAPLACASYSYNETLPLGLCDEGSGVTYVQQALQGLGYDVDDDGLFGPGTAAAVRAFQQSVGLTADGLVGPITYGALGGGEGLPGWDLNGDGMITPDEISGH